MKIKNFEIIILKIPFKIKFNHYLKSRESTENIILKLSTNNYIGIAEAIPREYVTGENIEKIIDTLNNKLILNLKKKEFNNMKDIIDYIAIYSKNIKKNELSAFACFSDALLNLGAQEFNFTIEDIFKYLKIEIKENLEINYSAVIGESNLIFNILKAIMIKFRGFKHVKIKISPCSLNQLNIISKILKKQIIYVDANCSFNIDNINNLINNLKKNNISFVEQPFDVENKDKIQIYQILQKNNISVILDESFCLEKDIEKISKEGNIVNLRINKNGGIIKTLILYKKLTEEKIPIILGCMVGETILTRENLIISKKIKTIFNEGNYDNYLFKNTIIDNPKFERNGVFKINNNNFDINQKINLKPNIDKYIIINNHIK